MKTILAPIDFSKVSDPVVKAAVNLAKAVNGRVVLLHIVQPPVITSEYGAVLANIQEIVAISEKTSAAELARRAKRLAATGVPVAVAQATGAAVAGILEQARKSKAAYIVIGSHGHSALYDLLAGSTATGVIRRASCPVLVVPPANTKKKGGK
ncbi:MAG: hypothetical protein RIS54_2337 [Verrucomicrobiota bacterium]|jgi:nucleotide-binding universal stress UspA family protein